jgi:hypothetical protein
LFPAIHDQTGCFASQYQFDILNTHINDNCFANGQTGANINAASVEK